MSADLHVVPGHSGWPDVRAKMGAAVACPDAPGAPIVVDDGSPNDSDRRSPRLTQRVDAGLREVTLNFRTRPRRRVACSRSRRCLPKCSTSFGRCMRPTRRLAESVRVAQRLNAIAPQSNIRARLRSRGADRAVSGRGLRRSSARRETTRDRRERCADEHAHGPGGVVRTFVSSSLLPWPARSRCGGA